MLTVDFERLGLRPGMRLLDLGCGGGRHAFAAWRAGATVVALDASFPELTDVRAVTGGMLEAGELPGGVPGGAVQGDALALPFPDDSFDRVVASEVLEHIWADERAMAELVRVLRPGGSIAVTVPSRFPERVCWALDTAYHDKPGGHIRIYRLPELTTKLERSGLRVRGSHRAHALHSPYWWVRCAGGVDRPDRLVARKYHDFLVWELTNRPRWSHTLEQTLNPVLGKSVVVYADKPQRAAPVPATPRATTARAVEREGMGVAG
jgi:SAM-dependent methyltransferase